MGLHAHRRKASWQPRCCRTLEWRTVLEEAKAWQHVEHAAQRLRRTYRSWSEMSENYLLGRRYWGEGEDLQKYFDAAAHWLLTDRRSPWRRLDWGIEPER
ncbi:MAG TPA: DUF1266 domain-containing protein [Thermoanaerobaculia bacterium]